MFNNLTANEGSSPPEIIFSVTDHDRDPSLLIVATLPKNPLSAMVIERTRQIGATKICETFIVRNNIVDEDRFDTIPNQYHADGTLNFCFYLRQIRHMIVS